LSDDQVDEATPSTGRVALRPGAEPVMDPGERPPGEFRPEAGTAASGGSAAARRPGEAAAPEPVGAGETTGSRSPVVDAIGLYLLTRVLLALAAGIGAMADHMSVAEVLSGWDGHWYLAVAARGYPVHPDLARFDRAAFFPLYPGLVRLLGAVAPGAPLVWPAVGLSFVAGAVFVGLATSLASRVAGPVLGRQAGLLLACFPGTVVLGVVYPDGLALAAVAGALLALDHDRLRVAAVAGAVATLASPLAAAVVPALVIGAWRRHGPRRALGVGGVAALGGVAAVAFIAAATEDPLAWFRVERLAWDQRLGVGGLPGAIHFGHALAPLAVASLAYGVVGLACLILGRAPASWLVLAAVTVALGLFDAGQHPSPRLLLAGFPLVLAVGLTVPERLGRILVVVSTALLPLTFLLYFAFGNLIGPP